MKACPAFIRDAVEADIPEIVRLLADDVLGATRETPDDLEPYHRAFARLASDPSHRLIVVERSNVVVGTLQLTFLPGLSRRGALRAHIESVRIAVSERGTGLGTQLMEWAIEEARKNNCSLIELTSDATRSDAHRWYERLGFAPSHTGFKRML